MVSKILRDIPPFKGKQRIARALFKSVIRTYSDLLVKGKFNCLYKIPNLKENIGFEIYINGIYEKGTIDFIISQIKPNGLFLDIGANIGAIVAPVCKNRTDITAICLEASSWIFEYLKYNITVNNLSNVTLLNNAIWSEDDKELEFFAPHDKYGKGSLAPVFTEDSQRVTTITIDNIDINNQPRKIDFIKIDVEGFEYHAFLGGAVVLKDIDAPSILFEFVDWAEAAAMNNRIGAAQELLLAYGYTLYKLTDGVIRKKMEAPIRQGASLIFATKRSLPDTL